MRKHLLYFFLGIFFISSAYALGCCVDLSTGTCSPNSEQTSCSNGGQWYADPSCSSVSSCSYGCCVIGTSVSYNQQSTCYFQADSSGQTYQWAATNDPASCTALITSNQTGACVSQQQYGNRRCLFTTKSSCSSGQFYPNTLCSEPTLNTSCTRTENTTCYGEEVHYLDTCGNPDAVKQACVYDQGLVCQQQDSKNAFCKDLNCKNPLTGATIPNGARWCIDPSGEGNVLLPEEFASLMTGEVISPFSGFEQKKAIKSGVKGTTSESGLFMKDKTQFNLITGNAVTQEYSVEECVAKNAENQDPDSQESEYAYSCSNEGAEEENVVYDPYTCEVCDQSLDACGDNLCERCKNDLGGESWSGRLNGCVSDNACGGETEASVGSRYFSQYCLNGDILNEPCDDFRMGYCDNAKTGGKCEINPWQECLASAVGTEDSSESISREVISESCDEEFCTLVSPSKQESENSEEATSSDSETSLMLEDLQMTMCVPKIPGGLQFYPPEGGSFTADSSAKDTCALANYQTTIEIYSPGSANLGFSYGEYFFADDWYIQFSNTENAGNPGENQYGNTGITDVCPEDVGAYSADNNRRKLLGNYVSTRIKQMKEEKQLTIRPEIVSALMGRCKAIADCDGKGNWIGEPGSKTISGNFEMNSDGDYTIPCSSVTYAGGKSTIKCSLDFICSAWKAPAGDSSCGACGADGLPCSEYRCKALGKGCDYTEPAGADNGYCVSASDNSAPSITGNANPNPVPPFSATTITINTNEVSYCKFNLGNAGSTIEDMPYDVDTEWSTTHTVALNVPGKMPTEDIPSQYNLITEDGNYNMYVRCEDVAGNSNPTATSIAFQVMQTPDQIPPSIYNITPPTNSFVAYNTSTKNINLRISEPAECKWSTTDQDYLTMENEMSCDTSISDMAVINGYSCTTTLTGITTNLSSRSTFYFRCQDQPWLEGNEDNYYKRNTNPTSISYTLIPSQALSITEVSPSGYLIVGANTNSILLSTKTANGANSGNAQCSWRLRYGNTTTAYKVFANTGSSTHTENVTNKTEGDYYIDVKCSDIAGNTVNSSSFLQLRYDKSLPEIARVLNNKGTFTLFTSEPAICKFKYIVDNLGCLFSIDSNTTTMYGKTNLQHTTTWTKGKSYFIKCQDYYGNVNTACDIVAKAV